MFFLLHSRDARPWRLRDLQITFVTIYLYSSFLRKRLFRAVP